MSKIRKRKLVCPKHGRWLEAVTTKYGTRYGCTVRGCDVACWAGSTSTPADGVVRRSRMAAHAAFDPLWKSQTKNRSQLRSKLYRELAVHLGLQLEDCHIGMFDEKQCEMAVAWCREKLGNSV